MVPERPKACKDVHSRAQSTYTVSEWCRMRRLSRTTFYRLQREGRGPRILKVGRKPLITAEADAEWLAKMEAESNG